MHITVETLDHPRVLDLLREHLAGMAEHSPPESIHALDLSGLKHPAVTVWSVWDGDDLMGIGALRELDAAHGELKSMRTARAHLRRGVAAHLLTHILDEARRRGYRRVSLETGSMAAFEPACRLYRRFGFTDCGPFADYRDDPNSRFMTLALGAA